MLSFFTFNYSIICCTWLVPNHFVYKIVKHPVYYQAQLEHFSADNHHHHVALPVRISLTLSRYPSLLSIAPGGSSRVHPVSARNCCIKVLAGRSTFARPCEGVQRSISLMSSSLTIYIYIYIYIYIKLPALIEGDPKALFSIATTPKCREGCYSFPWIAPLHLWSVPKMLSVEESSIKYHFLSLWYDRTPVSRTIREYSTH